MAAIWETFSSLLCKYGELPWRLNGVGWVETPARPGCWDDVSGWQWQGNVSDCRVLRGKNASLSSLWSCEYTIDAPTLLQTAQTTYRLRTTTATDRPVYTMLFLHHGVYCCNSDYKVASVRNLITLDRRVVVRSLFCCRPFALSASLIDCCLLRCFAVVSWFSYREYWPS